MGWLGGGAPKAPEASAQEVALGKNAVTRFNQHQQTFVPLEDSFIASLTPTAGEVDQTRGIATSDVAQAMKGADQGIVSGSGGQAGQGKSILARAGVATQAGIARGEAATGADAALKDREMKGLTKLSAFGRGLQDMNRVSLTDAAKSSTHAAIDKLNNKVRNQGSSLDAAGTFMGSALGNIGSMDSLKTQLQKKFGSTQ
jgi:hypothetical protein